MKLTIIGIGMGNPDTMTVGAISAISKAEVVFGAPRIIEAIKPFAKTATIINCYHPEEILKTLEECEFNFAVVAFSGDTGFHSGAKVLLEKASPTFEINVIAGISSVQYLSSKLFKTWEDALLVSAHGKEINIVSHLLKHKKIIVLTDHKNSPNAICKEIIDAGFLDVTVSVGEELSYENEKITVGKASEIKDKKFSSLATIMIENNAEKPMLDQISGLKDECFIRADVPMTKAEVRAVIISKLKLSNAKIGLDIGSGTGSVSIEMALNMPYGKIFAIEKDVKAFSLTGENIEKFMLYNIIQVNGMAPDVLGSLPAPDVAFLGGTTGKAKVILNELKQKNPNIRVVITAVTLETITDAISAMKELEFTDIEVIQLSISRTKTVGENSMLLANNPIFILSGGGGVNE